MQATVRSYDPRTGAGSVLLDDGREVLFPAGALTGSGLRDLRPGQRVQIGLSAGIPLDGSDSTKPAPETPYVTALTIHTLPEAGWLTPDS